MQTPDGGSRRSLHAIRENDVAVITGAYRREAAMSEQPGTWVTVLTGDMGNTFPVLFRSAVVDAVGLWATRLRCPQIHSSDVSACGGDRWRHER